jgi:hypothetical protein
MSNTSTTQKTMRACALEAYGGAERMRLMAFPVPALCDVLIPMYSAEVREWEALVRHACCGQERC